MTDIIFNGPNAAPMTVALAHGAGAPMDSPFMDAFAEGLAVRGLRCARFEFPYMAQRREDGKKRPPNPARILLESWREEEGELPVGLAVAPTPDIANLLIRTTFVRIRDPLLSEGPEAHGGS